MAFLKFAFVLFAIFAACGAAPSTRADAHNLFVCSDYTAARKVIYDEYVDVRGKLLQYVEHNVVFPNSNSVSNTEEILCVEVEDLDNNGKGGYYTIVSGGLQQYHATVNLKSQRSQGLRFIVRFYI